MPFADTAMARLPEIFQTCAQRHHELIKFAIVGGTTFIIDSAIFYTLKLSILETKPVTAKVIAGIVAVIASYVLNREWSFRDRGGHERHHEALLFFAFSGVGVLLSMAPLWFSSYVLQLREPMVSLTVENIADFVSAYIIGNLLQMAFRFWALRRWVFPDAFARNPDIAVEESRALEERALESALTAGGMAEVFEDTIESGHHMGNVTFLRGWRGRGTARFGQLGDSSGPRVSKTS